MGYVMLWSLILEQVFSAVFKGIMSYNVWIEWCMLDGMDGFDMPWRLAIWEVFEVELCSFRL